MHIIFGQLPSQDLLTQLTVTGSGEVTDLKVTAY